MGPTHDLSVYRGPTSCRMPILNPPANYSQPTDNQSPMSQISPKQKAQLDDTIHEPQLLHQRHHPSPHRSSQHHNRLMKMCKQAGSQLPTPYPTGFSTGIQGVYQQNGFLSSNGLPAHILSMAHSSSHFSDNSVSNFITSSAGPCSSGCDYSHSDSLNTFTATQQLQRPYMNGFIKSQTPSYLGFMPTTATASIADSSGTVGTGDALIESEDAFLSMLRQQAKANTSSVQLGSLLAATASASSVAMSICPSTLSTSSSAFSTELRNNSLSSDYKFHSGGGNFSPTPLHHLGAPGQMVSGCPSERFLESLLVPGCSGLESELGPVTSGGAESLGARLTKRERFMSELDLTASVEDCCTSLGSLSAVNGSANAVDRRRRRDMLTSSLLSSVLSE
ncbi:unnamed protein product [Protopolystoma xenopodis]|uniref:Uncharacterized protein n=1 Tax=Protopolystoma xenopodis TaxID=117903 RepID=A0A448WQH5_9PLAT|nr:unnamed protein product [Protopolystoma xenopodis]